MKKIQPRILLATALIPLGLIIAAVPENTTRPYKLTAQELLNEANEGQQFMNPDEVAKMIVEKDASLQLIDLRSAEEFEKFSLPNAINIPMEKLLSDEFVDVLNQDTKLNVLYSNSSTMANQAWMVIRQLGYKNNYVLQGGLNYWMETIMNPQKPAEGSPNEELAKYEFRKAAGAALGGSAESVTSSVSASAPAAAPAVQKTKKKKGAQGGC